jgi:TonB-linked SusC/RagA family outer membrane protein
MILFLTVSALHVSAGSNAQNVNFSCKEMPIKKVFSVIKSQTGYTFFYDASLLREAKPVSVKLTDVPLETALQEIFDNQPLTWTMVNRTITIVKKSPELVTKPVNPALTMSMPPLDIIGVVNDENGKPLSNASVTIKGTNKGTTTDANGNFTLQVPDGGGTLVISSIGYQTIEVPVNKAGPVSVVLKAAEQKVEEVVVVGYGTQRKTSVTSAVSQVKGADLTRRPVSNLPQALQGQAPGLTVLDRGGEPGRTTSTMRIRGITSFSGNSSATSSPLIIVDGVEQTFYNLNPEDVENISVLKDASSTAIYGSRAANGVVLVTTKRARAGEVKVTYNGYYAIQNSINDPVMMEGEAYMRYEQLAYQNQGLAVPVRYQDTSISKWVNATDRYRYPYPNTWFQTVLKSAPQYSNNFSFSGGNENVKSRVSFRMMDQQGIAPNYSAKIRELRMNNDFNLSKKLRLTFDQNYRYNYSTAPFASDVFNRFIHGTLWAAPKYPNGTYGLSPQNFNPLLLAEQSGYNNIATHYLYGTAKLDYEIIRDLTLSAQVSGVLNYQEQKAFQNQVFNRDTITGGVYSVANNALTETRSRYYEITTNFLLNYRKKLNKHEFQGLLGYSELYNNGDNLSAYRERFYNNSIEALGQGANDATKNNSGNEYEFALQSVFARFNYAYDGKYLLEINGRYDGSSRFAPGNQYSFFPSFSAAWRISRESFFENLNLPIEELKFRGSWGQTGNQNVALYSYYSSLASGSYTFGGVAAQTYSPTTLADPSISWETNEQLDLGMDAEMFGRSLVFSIDYYTKRTDGILLALPLPSVTGFTSSNQNGGVIDNKGWEFMLGYHNNRNPVQWSLNGNFAINDNEVIDLKGAGPFITGWDLDPRYIVKVGLPFNAHWGYKTAGYFQNAGEIASYPTYATNTKPGDVKYVDLNSDGRINADDMTMIGNPFPKYTYGFTGDVRYKNFGINIFFQGAAKVDTRLSGAITENGIAEGFTPDLVTNNYWTEKNTNARFPLPRKSDFRNVATSDRLIIDGSYLRLKNLQVSYTLSADNSKKIGISGAMIYVSATNLWTISKLNEWHLDPEAESGRAIYYPQTRMMTLGLNLNF